MFRILLFTCAVTGLRELSLAGARLRDHQAYIAATAQGLSRVGRGRQPHRLPKFPGIAR